MLDLVPKAQHVPMQRAAYRHRRIGETIDFLAVDALAIKMNPNDAPRVSAQVYRDNVDISHVSSGETRNHRQLDDLAAGHTLQSLFDLRQRNIALDQRLAIDK